MNEHDLRDELTGIGGRLAVGDPPTIRILVAARTRRRGSRVLAGVAGVVAAAALVGGLALWRGGGLGEQPVVAAPPTSAAPPSNAPAPTTPPPRPTDTRVVGVGRAQIIVPISWGTNDEGCGTPRRDTVFVDLGAIALCYIPRPKGVESVTLSEGPPPPGFRADDEIRIGEVAAQRQRTTCSRPGPEEPRTCVGAVYLPSLDASFRAESSTGAEEVDRLLGSIAVSPDRVAVPGFRTLPDDPRQADADRYAARLTDLGLVPSVRTTGSPGRTAGYIVAVQPGPGTMVTAGTKVRMTVVG